MMKQRTMLLGGLAVACITGIGITVFTVNPGRMNIAGSVLERENAANPEPAEQTATTCRQHEQCAQGEVCKEGVCAAADTRFCSQDFMLAESLEGRFIRYTLCPVQCVRSGDSAFCK